MQWAFVPRRYGAIHRGCCDSLQSDVSCMPGGFTWVATCFTCDLRRQREDRSGTSRSDFYLLWRLAATGAQLSFSLGRACRNLGPRGRFAGVLGAYILMFHRDGSGSCCTHDHANAAWIVIGLWFALQLFSGIGSIANTAQFGWWASPTWRTWRIRRRARVGILVRGKPRAVDA